ncbi:MAG TPA: hypothetical protein VGJ39_01550 [Vicinamibacterales bacterium]|jgi:hypothetical protein
MKDMNAGANPVSQLMHSQNDVDHSDLALQQVSHADDVAARVALALLNQNRGKVVSAALRVALTAIAPILVVCALSAPPLPSSSACTPVSTVATGFHDHEPPAPSDTSAVLVTNATAVEEWEAKGSPDLYGNEVSDAVARYKLDDEGSLYEVHSPQTELPRLAPPIS